ncbi:MAG: DNA-processing protein DprA [Hyphomicrobiales bacterium]
MEARERDAIRRALEARAPRGAAPPSERDVEDAARLLHRAGGRARSIDAPDYPPRLRSLAHPPETVFLAGPWDHDGPIVAVVGSRRANGDGCDVARSLASELAGRGVAIVSGLALGIDAAAHEGALAVGGRSGAVLGTGLERAYPPGHEALQAAVRDSLGLLSELAPGESPRRATFAERNRLLAALADAVVVVQGDPKSGALLTAKAARGLGRPVGAVPWDPREALGAAPHELIRDGRATLVRDADDVLALIGVMVAPAGLSGARAAPGAPRRSRPSSTRRATRAAGPPASETGAAPDAVLARVLDALRFRPEPLDDVALRAGLAAPDVAVALLALELSGRARREPGGRYGRVRER